MTDIHTSKRGGRRLLVCAPLVSATLVGCLLRPSGRTNGGTPSDANGMSDANPDAHRMSDAIAMPDGAEPVDGASMTDGAMTTPSCATGYTPVACNSCSGTTMANSDGSRKYAAGGSCSCSASFTEAYVHLDASSGAGLSVTFTMSSMGGSQGLRNDVGVDVLFLSMGSASSTQSSTAMAMDLGFAAGSQSVAGYYATVMSPAAMIGGTGWTQVGSASTTPSFPAMINISVFTNNGLPPANPVGGTVTVSSICVK